MFLFSITKHMRIQGNTKGYGSFFHRNYKKRGIWGQGVQALDGGLELEKRGVWEARSAPLHGRYLEKRGIWGRGDQAIDEAGILKKRAIWGAIRHSMRRGVSKNEEFGRPD